MANLVSNASKFTVEGRIIRVEVMTQLQALQPGKGELSEVGSTFLTRVLL
jgi:hypothetical protein